MGAAVTHRPGGAEADEISRPAESVVGSHSKWRFLIRSDAYLALAPFR
jgi:hypothetical protein